MKYSVRAITATGGYVDSIRWMDRVCFPQGPRVSFDGAFWWMAFDEDDVPAGFAGLTIFPNNVGFLSRSGVLPGARGNGLQRRLVQARERYARSSTDVRRLVTYTSTTNIYSSNNLIRCGYNLYQPEYWWGLAYANYWEKRL